MNGTTTRRPEQLRILSSIERRKQFRVQVICAAIYKHPHGQELRVFLEPEENADLLWSELAPWDFSPLEQKASDLRAVLLEKGWTELLPSAATGSDAPTEQDREERRDRADRPPNIVVRPPCDRALKQPGPRRAFTAIVVSHP